MKYSFLSEFLAWAIYIVYIQTDVLIFVLAIVLYDLLRVSLNLCSLQEISDGNLYLIYEGKLFLFYCSCLGISHHSFFVVMLSYYYYLLCFDGTIAKRITVLVCGFGCIVILSSIPELSSTDSVEPGLAITE